jgi:ADP-dependent NAD(P)H-hydrate dehydratase / NAD(P)H-hydrate epimerase
MSAAIVVSIDVPSGLFMDISSKGNTIIEADHTLTFQTQKRGLLVQENGPFIGDVHVFHIGLHPDFIATADIHQELVDDSITRQIYRPRNRFSHKGAFGHALLVGGSYGKMGAAVLAARACIHTGVGLLTCDLPKCGYEIMQTAVPEAMVITGEDFNSISLMPDEIEKYSCIGIGPGIGTSNETQKIVSFIIRRYRKPLVIDADGLNCLAIQKELLDQLHPFSVLTPHPKEFDRLFGNHENDFDRIETARKRSRQLNCIIVLKGHHTQIATPAGQCYFNSTGNAGMAKGGSGDVLTGIITSLVAQNYSPLHAAILGVYIHGLAGDLAAKALSQEFMTPGNMIQHLAGAFRKLSGGTAM